MRVQTKILLLSLAALLGAYPVSAQTNRQRQNQSTSDGQYTVSGKIIDAENGSPLEMVNITFQNNAFWAVTDMQGKFSLKLKNGTYQYSVSYIGYETATGTIKVNGKNITDFNIKLQATSLGLSEVVVTAKEQAMGSSSVIDQTALQHLQPMSITDMLQMTPGSVTTNPTVTSAGQAKIREIGSEKNNAMGASIIVDGAPISNDATLMTTNTAKSGTSGLSSQSVTGGGADLRTISPDNVESVEVIRGIPSAEYGNLTSGAVIIKTKQGSTPLEVKGKADPRSKMLYLGKGLTLGTGTTLNMAIDYTESYADTRFKARGYERVTGDVGLSHTFFSEKPLSVNAKVAYFQNINDVRKDPQAMDSEVSKSENRGIRFTLNGDWNIKTALVSNLSYNLSVNYSHQHDTRTEWMILKSGIQPVGNSYVEGEHQAFFLRGNYYSNYYVDGKPLDIFGQIKATKTIIGNENLTSSFKAGLEWAYDANKGDGLVHENDSFPSVINDIQTVRPRSYKDIPAMSTASAFFENKSIFPIANTSMTLQAGIRAGYLFIDKSYLKADNMLTVDPRINAEWTLISSKNDLFFDNLSLTGGWGLTSKMPSLAYLYPDKAYFDELSYSHISPYLAVTTTKIKETTNTSIKPSRGNKMEFGLSMQKGKVDAMVTFFYEQYKNEFGYQTQALSSPYNKYEFNLPNGADDITYENGMIHYNLGGVSHIEPATNVTLERRFRTYSQPTNNKATKKMGVEYSVNFGQFKKLRTSLVVDGAWLWVRHYNDQDYWKEGNYKQSTGGYYPYVVLSPGGLGDIDQRTNTNFKFITHIPEVKMVFTTTAEIVWSESSQTKYLDRNGNDRWYKTTNMAGQECLAVDPVGYMDHDGNYFEWNNSYRDKSTVQYNMVSLYSSLKYFDKEKYPGYAILNFRLTKELGDKFEFSFMANNMFNSRKLHKLTTTSGYTNLTISQYFGAELKIKI